jgi:hypothetical protein
VDAELRERRRFCGTRRRILPFQRDTFDKALIGKYNYPLVATLSPAVKRRPAACFFRNTVLKSSEEACGQALLRCVPEPGS